MPQRSFSAQDLIALPFLSASEMIAIVAQLETRAREHKLPADVAEALADVGTCRDTLVDAQRKKIVENVPTSPEAIAADRAVDRAWGATGEWLAGWTRLGDPKYAPHVDALTTALFADGLAFLNLPYLGEWTESDLRVQTIKAKKLDANFRALGGEAFLKAVMAAHEAYGKALGITEASKTVTAAPDVRVPLAATQEALREYIAKVVAMATKKKPKTVETVAALLEPITSRETKRRAPPAPVPPPAAPSP